jgi:tripartite-type tricarboxylate transporter receptor subunit TctC
MSKRIIVFVALLALVAFAFISCAKKEEKAEMWTPTKPIQIIVPWGAGGSTDQMTRVVAGDLEEHLGQKIVVVNQPGASGSVGTKNAMDAAHDGYTWAAGAAADLGAYKVRGLIDSTLDDWVLYLTVANVSVMSVNADEPYQDFGELLQAFKDKPGDIPVATAGQLSAGHNSMIAIQKYTDLEYKHVTYDGGNPAVIATVAGECVAVPQLAVEQADMLAGGKLRALAVLDDKPLELEKYGSIEPITKWVPDFRPAPNYFGIWIPKDAPQEVIQAFGKLWDDVMENSEALKKYAASRGAVFDPSWGDEGKEKAMPYLSIIAWNLHEAGETVMSPAEVGIPQP